jgi:predicted DNA repair protein MutK
MVAMLMVGGGILIHNLYFLHGLEYFGSKLPYFLPQFMQFFATPVAVSLAIGAIILVIKESVFSTSKV